MRCIISRDARESMRVLAPVMSTTGGAGEVDIQRIVN